MQLHFSSQTAPSLRGPFKYSAVFHLVLFTSLALSTVLSHRGELWGGAGGEGSVNINLVGSVPAIPLPKPNVVTTNRVVDNTKGLYQEQPQPKPKPEEDKNAVALPKFDLFKKPDYMTHQSRPLPNPTPPPPNAIPYGHGGAPNIPYTSFTLGQKTPGGMGMSGTSGGDFGNQFPWYVEAVQRRVSSNWLQSTVDPTIAFAPRAIVTFEILRDGTVQNIQILQSSGNQSVDQSAVRAIRNSSPLAALPPEYKGSYVSVEFWFDFHRQ